MPFTGYSACRSIGRSVDSNLCGGDARLEAPQRASELASNAMTEFTAESSSMMGSTLMKESNLPATGGACSSAISPSLKSFADWF